MATTKKPAAKKTATKASTARKTPVKKAPAKKPVASKAAATKAPVKRAAVAKKPVVRKKATKKAPAMRSFHVYQSDQGFNDFRITRQTIYWIVLMCFIIFVQLWILKLQYEVMNLIDLQDIESISLYQ